MGRMRRGYCHGCSYFKEMENGEIINYCNNKDCRVDPYEPECNYD